MGCGGQRCRGARGVGHRRERGRRRAEAFVQSARDSRRAAAARGRHPSRSASGVRHACRAGVSMIRLDRVTFHYPERRDAALRDVDLTVPEGELCLVIGETGAGKSTLLRSVNGLVPHFTGGTLRGTVSVDGRSTAAFPPRELAATVGVVNQDPSAGFVADTVEDELAYVMENLGIEPQVMRRRVEDALDLLAIADLRGRALGTLSSGEAQRVAIASVLTAAPRVLVLDEPTSALDPGAAEDVLAALTRLVHDLGLTILAAEHRLERIVQYADRIAVIDELGGGRSGGPEPMMRHAPRA